MILSKLPKQQSGVALLVALSFMVVITLISIAGMRSSTTELRLASNNEARIAAVEVTQSAIDAVASNANNFVVTGTVGTARSSTNNDFSIGTDVSEFSHATVTLTEGVTTNPPRGLGLSADKFQGTIFDVSATYDNLAGKRGKAEIEQGMVLLIPKT